MFGYENLASDFDILGDGATEPVIQERPHSQRDSSLPDMSEILQRVRECDDPEEKKRIVEEYNRRRSEGETDSVQGTSENIFQLNPDAGELIAENLRSKERSEIMSTGTI